MFHNGKTLVIRKYEHYDVELVLRSIAEAPAGAQVAVHLRDATYGARDLANLHPQVLHFEDQGDYCLAVMHNGEISALKADPISGPSDTFVFVNTWLAQRLAANPRSWCCPLFLAAITAFVGPRNRLVLLDREGTLHVLGAEQGFTHGDIWLSNLKVQPWI
jgi:hypothetical protein